MCSYDLAHPSAARYPVEHFPGQNLPDLGGFDSLQYLITKRVHHQRPRCCLVYAPRSHIKDGFLVDMADRRSVAALDVVGQYLELGLVLISASGDNSRFLLLCFASVFCASFLTTMEPLKTPVDLPARI